MRVSPNDGSDIPAGIAAYQAAEFANAAAIFADILRHSPDDPTALRLRGLALTRDGRTEEALPFLSRARQLAFDDPLTHLHYGLALQESGKHARAAALFRRAATMAPQTTAPWINFAAALIALGLPKPARAASRRAIAIAPNDADAHYTLGLAETAADNPAGAHAAFLAATRARPPFADAWVNLGLACYRLGNVDAAMQAMRAALAQVPTHGAAEANLCAFLLLRGETDEALARLRAILVRDPACVPARLNLANALLLDREAEPALDLLDAPAPPGRDHAHWRAHRALALLLLDRVREAEAELDAITNPYDAEILILWRRLNIAARRGDMPMAEALAERVTTLAADDTAAFLEHRVIACFELARFEAARSRPEKAFTHWRSGHSLLAKIQPFSRERHAEFVDASIAAFDHARLHAGPRAATADAAPVFIVGMPRSGTTLAEQILAAHPMVHGAGERPAIHQLTRHFCADATGAEGVRKLAAVDADALTSAAEKFLTELHAAAPDARLILDKMPANALHLGFIATLLPGARIIHCRRDPRDVGLSIFQLRFFGYHPYAHDLGDLGWYIRQHDRLMDHWRATLPLPLLDLDLADWVNDFSATLCRVLTFLDLPYDAACETYYLNPRRIRTASATQVRQPINARGLGRWRQHEQDLAPMLEELNKS